MVAIPEQGDPTLLALKKQTESVGNIRKARDYLGASLIGNECPRQIWYTYRGYSAEPFSAETLWNFEDGHRTEDLIADRFRKLDFIEIHTHDPKSGNQFGFSDFNGKFKGHCDGFIKGLIQAPNAWHVWECKASSEKKWKEFHNCKAKYDDKQVLENWNYNYFVQAQLYMHYFKVDRHYMTVAYAGGRDLASCRTEYQPEVAEKYRDRAHKIINSIHEPPRISDKKDYYICRWCNFKDECHKNA